MVVGFTTTSGISANHHLRWEFESHSWRGVLNTTLCDQVYQWLVAGLWFSPSTPISSTNKTNHHDIIQNIVESGVKHHNPPHIFLINLIFFVIAVHIFFICLHITDLTHIQIIFRHLALSSDFSICVVSKIQNTRKYFFSNKLILVNSCNNGSFLCLNIF